VVPTWHGLCIRAFSLLGRATACLLFQFNASKNGYNRVDATVTYVLLIGAFILEMATDLHILMSTWTRATLKARRWDRLYRPLVSLRRLVTATQINRKWEGSIGSTNPLVDSMSGGKASLTGRMFSLLKKKGNNISPMTKELVLRELLKMVEASKGDEIKMRSLATSSH
jgi:hypothetical protein